MEIEVRLFATFRVGRWMNKRLSFKDDAKIMDVLDYLGIKKEELGLVLVNGSYKEVYEKLNNEDILAIFPPVAGG
ncbi:MoaD/ThiS family protein [Sedimentibacter saalensis]|uniref:MoaD/ThiS family protein n=1 Tax=Sedimentibacter saalensis TaxID=130788 RepID=UPI00289BBF26|nr:MoaD/ThiS family protein [Sedimentibacter saalensis]